MQLPWFEAVLTLAFVEEVRLEFPTGVFFSGRHCFFFTSSKHSVGLKSAIQFSRASLLPQLPKCSRTSMHIQVKRKCQTGVGTARQQLFSDATLLWAV